MTPTEFPPQWRGWLASTWECGLRLGEALGKASSMAAGDSKAKAKANAKTQPQAQPVTVIARHCVRPDKEGEFQAWMRGVTQACSGFEGYVSTELVRPAAGRQGDHVSIFRFDTYPNLERWMTSEQRRSWLDRLPELTRKEPDLSEYESLEFWFTPDEGPTSAGPPKHKMALATFVVIWPLVHFVPRGVAKSVPLQAIWQEGLSVLLIVLIMTYAVMPLTTRVPRPWLFRAR